MQRQYATFQQQKGKSYSQGKLEKQELNKACLDKRPLFQKKSFIVNEEKSSNLKKIDRKKYDQEIEKQSGQLKKINQTIKQKEQLITEMNNKFLVLCDQLIELPEINQSQRNQIANLLQDLSKNQVNLIIERNNLLKDQSLIQQRLKKKKQQQFFIKEKEQQPFSGKSG